MADEAEPTADQHRVRLSKRIVDRTRDLSTVRDGETQPVLDLGQEDDSKAGMSNDYVGNSSVNSVLTDIRDPGVTLNTQDLQSGLSHSNDLESDPRIVKNDIQISAPQSYKAQKTESENEQIELDAGEETGLPRGNRAGPVADILLHDNQMKMSPPQKTPLKWHQEEIPDMDADGMLFNQVSLTEKRAPEKNNDSAVSMETVLTHPDIPAGVRGALKKVQADFTGQPDPQKKRTTTAQVEQTQKISIGRVSVRVKLPEAKAPAHEPVPLFAADKIASRYFMGEV
jgi:hypothetical protein